MILSGGPESVTDTDPPRAPPAVFELGVPVLGICYGMQTMAQQLGGRVAPSSEREFGYAEVSVTGGVTPRSMSSPTAAMQPAARCSMCG